IGYPVVVQLNSETITHKTDVQGVQLNLKDEKTVRDAYETIRAAVTEKHGAEHFQGVTVQPMAKLDGYELIIGSSPDPQFGPVLLFGMGGQLVEVFKDSALALPPLNTTLARRMMERTKIYKALKGVRGRQPVDLGALEQIMVRFSTLVSEQPWIKELDINPLVASPENIIALDARVVIYGSEMDAKKLPRLAIRPYPQQYVSQWTTKDGTQITFRPIRAEDEPLLYKFHTSLSDRSVYLRWLQPLSLSEHAQHERLSRIAHGDYDRVITLVADRYTDDPDALRITAAARMSKLHGTNAARFSLLVSDCCQGQGIGEEIFRRMLDIARQEKMERLEAIMSADNAAMRRLCEKYGFKISQHTEGMVRADLAL
ncbi:MAG: GNAT family N-acetyltransferase, partial [Chloroflexota bacterium]